MQYKIIVGDGIEGYRKGISDILIKKGYKVYLASDTGSVLRIARTVFPELILMDVNLNGMTAYETAKIIESQSISTVVFMTNNPDETLFSNLAKMNIYAYLTKPLKPSLLLQTVEFSIINSIKINKLKGTINKLESNLEGRKKIDKAKGLLMEHKKITEDEAYKYMRKRSMDKCISMEELASAIILSFYD